MMIDYELIWGSLSFGIALVAGLTPLLLGVVVLTLVGNLIHDKIYGGTSKND